MTQREFEERTGRKVETEEYDRANRMYMTTAVGKDEFCAEWEKGLKDSTTAHAMAAMVEYNGKRADGESLRRKDAEKKAEELQNEYNQLQESYDDLCNHAQDPADESTAKENEVSALEGKVKQLEAEKATLYKLLEKLLDK